MSRIFAFNVPPDRVWPLRSPDRLGPLPEPRPKIEVKIFDHVPRMKYDIVAYEVMLDGPFHEGLWETRLRNDLEGKTNVRGSGHYGHSRWIQQTLWFGLEETC